MRKILNKNGFTIVEIIVTLAVLGIVIAPLITMFITSQKINNEGSKEYKSIQLAQKYMEEIKAMDTFSYSSLGYSRTELGSDYIYKKEIPESPNDYGATIVLKAVKETATAASAIDYDATLTISSTAVTYQLKDLAIPQYTISLSGDTDINVNETGIKIEETNIPYPLVSRKIKVVLSTNAIINIHNNLSDMVELYIHNLDSTNYNCTVNVKKGSVQKINNNSIIPVAQTAKNILYDITITVKKGSEIINTINSTKIFKYIPN